MSEPQGSLVWGVSSIADVPNVVVMGCLLVLLLVLERRHRRMPIRLWILALGIVFFDQLLWLLPSAQTTLRTFTHTTRLVGELLAGLTFLLYESAPSVSFSRRRRFLLINAAPLVALQVLYGLNTRSTLPYLVCAGAAVLLQVAAQRREWPLAWYVACLPLLWSAVALLALAHNFRTAAYSAAAYVFVAATWNFWQQLRGAFVGRVVVTGSLFLWAGSLLVHPWVMSHPVWRPIAEQAWAMQKFIVTFGIVVALFEQESREHEHLSHHDTLTGLPNRRRLEPTLRQHIAAGKASVLIVDLDGFKQVNDLHGHAAGDLVLQEISRRLSRLCRPGEMLARVGGDEFILVSGNDLLQRQSLVSDAISQPVPLSEGVADITASIGLARYPADSIGVVGSEAVSTLLKTADLRMYAAKHRQPRRAAPSRSGTLVA